MSVFAPGFGDAFVDYYAHIKAAEFARCRQKPDGAERRDVTAWEQKEYSICSKEVRLKMDMDYVRRILVSSSANADDPVFS